MPRKLCERMMPARKSTCRNPKPMPRMSSTIGKRISKRMIFRSPGSTSIRVYGSAADRMFILLGLLQRLQVRDDRVHVGGRNGQRRHSGLYALHDLRVRSLDRLADVGVVGDDGRAVRQLALPSVETFERAADRLGAVERMARRAALVFEHFASAREHRRRRSRDGGGDL